MEGKPILSDNQTDLFAFEKRHAIWKQRYEHYLQMMDEYYRGMEGYRYQLALHDEERQHIREMREDLEREKIERAFRRATRLPPI